MKKFRQLAIILTVVMAFTCIPTVAMAATVKAPAKVSSLSVKQTSTTTLTVKWKKISSATGYQIYASTSKTGKYSKIKTITSAKTVSYKHTKRTLGKAYYYKVRAYKKVSGKIKYGSFSSVKGAYVDYMSAKLAIYKPATVTSEGKYVVTVKNNGKIYNVDINTGLNFILEDVNSVTSMKMSGLKATSYVKGGVTVTPKSSFEVIKLKPGESVTLTMEPYKDANDLYKYLMSEVASQFDIPAAELLNQINITENVNYSKEKSELGFVVKYRNEMNITPQSLAM